MKNKRYLQPIWAICAILVIVPDQAIKRFILANYVPYENFGEIPGVADFIYVQNTGAAFSMLSDGTMFLSIISIIFCIAVAAYWFIKRNKHFMLKLALMLLFSGALGNAIDRIAYRFVVDFISIKWFNFPVFNIADIAIVSGAIAAVLYVIFFDKDEKKAGEANE